MICAALGDVDATFAWLEKGFEQREFSLSNILYRMDPFLDSVKPDPRYRDLIQRMNFPNGDDFN